MIADPDNALQGGNAQAGYFSGSEEKDAPIRLRAAWGHYGVACLHMRQKWGRIDPGCIREYVKVRCPSNTIYICLSGRTIALRNSVTDAEIRLRYLIMEYYVLQICSGRVLDIYICSSGRRGWSGAMTEIRSYFRKLEKSSWAEELDFLLYAGTPVL